MGDAHMLYHIPSQEFLGSLHPPRQDEPKAKAFLPSTMQPIPHPGTEAVHAAHTGYRRRDAVSKTVLFETKLLLPSSAPKKPVIVFVVRYKRAWNVSRPCNIGR
jgi:hypothetical protein